MGLRVDAVPGVVIDNRRGDLDYEEAPFDGPAENEIVNQSAGAFRAGKADGEPDPNSRDSAEHARKNQKELGVSADHLQPVAAALAPRLGLREGEVKPAAHREVRDHDVENRNRSDDPAATDPRNVPYRVIHDSKPSLYARVTPNRQDQH